MRRTSIKVLSAAAIDAKPVDFDWSEGFGETWDIVIPRTSDWDKKRCMAWIEGESLELSDLNLDKDAELSDIQERIRERMNEDVDRDTPVMNYYYPLPSLDMKAEEAQAILDDSYCSLTIALVDDTPVMSLTGGGMDFSWGICEAYMLLGYLPPVHFRLPEMGGKDMKSPRTRWVLAGYTESCKVNYRWAKSQLARTRELRKWLREHSG